MPPRIGSGVIRKLASIRGGTAAERTFREKLVPAFQVTRSQAQTLTTATSTVITFGVQTYLRGGVRHTLGESKVYPTILGYWLFGHGGLAYADNATGRRLARILYNGAVISAADLPSTVAGASTAVAAPPVLYRITNDADYVELEGYQSSGGDLTVEVTNYSPNFWGIWQGRLE